MARKNEEETPQKHHDAHEKRTCKRHALPGVTRIWDLCVSFSFFSLLIQSMAGSFFPAPFTGFLWPGLHEEEGGAKHSTGEFNGGILCVGWEGMELG